ncbi:MAG: GTP cyclohydrolase I FolE [Promethearchaeota archaeon]
MNKVHITWQEIQSRLDKLESIFDHKKVYGVPKGGMILSSFIRSWCYIQWKPEDADIILDDLIDSGATLEHYQKLYPDKPFYALFDKRSEYKNQWLVMPWEADHPGQHKDSIQQNIIRQLQYIGEDPNREGLKETPNRIVRSWDEIFCGYNQNPEELFTTFTADGYNQIVLLKNFEIYSMCEHHMLPFFGKAHVAYIPNKKVIGISKLARLVDVYARRLQIQERIGQQVTDDLTKYLQPQGAACIIEATHMCMRMRGVNKQNSIMTTSSMRGAFMDKPSAREELMQLIRP